MKTPSNQLSLFDESGMPPVDYGLAAITSGNAGQDIEFAGMKFKLTCEGDRKKFFSEVLEALGDLHRCKDEISCTAWLNGIGTVNTGTWEEDYLASVRANRHHAVIEVNQRKKFVEINLPHPDLWSAHGLDWMRKFQNCCARNKANSSPWLGACCGCPPRL